MKRVFTGLAALLFLAVIAQFFLAASGAFDSAPTDEAFQPHRVLGYSILILAVVVTVVGAIAQMPRRIVGIAGLAVVLVLVQVVIAEVAKAFGDGSTAGTSSSVCTRSTGCSPWARPRQLCSERERSRRSRPNPAE